MNKIYTRTGDKGMASLLGGERYDKNSIFFQTIGDLDELNALLGIIISYTKDKEILIKLSRVQNDLFKIAGDIASQKLQENNLISISEHDVTLLEKEIDQWQKQLPPLHNFIFPSGVEPSAFIHLARAVCRRGERSFVSLNQKTTLKPELLAYINRLSDWLFVLARIINEGQEKIWKLPSADKSGK
jgi:cob(I)alamin adenosyltransferase